jgi:hypothetical protein
VCQWLFPNVLVWLLLMYQYSSFRMYQYSFFRMYVDCHVTKSKVQAGAVTLRMYYFQDLREFTLENDKLVAFKDEVYSMVL